MSADGPYFTPPYDLPSPVTFDGEQATAPTRKARAGMKITLTAEDFALLVLTDCVANPDALILGRFEAVGPGDIAPGWQYVYWVGPGWAAVVLARAYLDSLGEAYRVARDLAEKGAFGFVILTNYAVRAEEGQADES